MYIRSNVTRKLHSLHMWFKTPHEYCGSSRQATRETNLLTPPSTLPAPVPPDAMHEHHRRWATPSASNHMHRAHSNRNVAGACHEIDEKSAGTKFP